MTIKIVTDSTSDIPEKMVEKQEIAILPLYIVMNGEIKKDIDWKNEDFYKAMESSVDFPKSSQPSVEEIYRTFEDIVKNGDSIIGIFLSSELSGTYSTASIVKNHIIEKYPKAEIEIIDSKSTSMQMGFLATEAVKAVKEGKNMKEVVQKINQIKSSSRFIFTPETLEYLHKGGRIGGASALIGNLLSIKPILTVVEGRTTVYTKTRTRKKAIEVLVKKLHEDMQDNIPGGVMVHHINCEELGKELAERIKIELGMEVPIQSIGPVIGTHVGPGSIGIAYWWKQK